MRSDPLRMRDNTSQPHLELAGVCGMIGRNLDGRQNYAEQNRRGNEAAVGPVLLALEGCVLAQEGIRLGPERHLQRAVRLLSSCFRVSYSLAT
jgi:hypothetical protein